MEYIIYGFNRVAKDFIYIFDTLNIAGISDDIYVTETPEGLKVYTVDEMLELKKKIIICEFENERKNERRKFLESRGLTYGEEFFYEKDFFDSLNDFTVPENRKLVVWGTGNMCRLLLDKNPELHIDAYIDSNRRERFINDKLVMKPNEISDWKSMFIVVAVSRDGEIIRQLKSMGLQNEKDFVSFHKIIGMPSRMLERTIFDEAGYKLECKTMLNHLEIFHNGNTRCCCTTFVSENLDNVCEKTRDELWHSNLHKIMCLSTENQTYSFCEKTMCPLFVGKNSFDNKCWNDRKYERMTEKPEVMALGHDSSCNLCCVTCREKIYHACEVELQIVNQVTDIIKKQYLDGCKFLIMAGDGEVFLAKSYKDIYGDIRCNPDFIRLLSNGMLLNESTWEQFKKGKKSRVMLTVSVDAATKETYEKIRRNGNFDILKENMEFAARLKKKGELSYFRMNFVVQKENYKEMPEFVKWAESLDANEVFFTKILNWGTYTDEEFKEISMMEPDGITPKKELKDVLNDPKLKSPIVDLGTIQYMHKMDDTENVRNYYMWELEKRGGKLFS